MAYAEKGKPTFPCEGKRPLTPRGFKDATTDPRRIHAWQHRWPQANVGMPTGERSGVFVLDEDRSGAVEELEREHGPLPKTLTAKTPRGGRHLYFRHVDGITNSPGGLPAGIDVRGEGGYVLVAPSAGYSWEDRSEVAEAPDWLVELVRERTPRPRRRDGGPRPRVEGGLIPEGRRNGALTSIAGKLHDGTRNLAQLTEDLLTIRDERCEEPETFPDKEVEKIARWVHGKEPCRPEKTPELSELVDALSAHWYQRERKRLGGKNEVRFMRLLIREGERIGTASEEGLRVKMSFLQAARELGCHVNTITNVRDRLREKGELRYDQSERSSKRDPGTFVLLDPRRTCDSQSTSLSPKRRVGATITNLSRKEVYDLETAHHRHRGPVGYSGEDVLCHVEGYGPKTAEELARLLGWSRARDLRLRHLDPRVELGLLERRGDLYAVPGDYRERRLEARREAYSTVQARVARIRSEEGLWVHVVRESGMVASEAERERLDAEAADRKRQAFHEHLAKDTPQGDESCRELLNAVDEQREAAGEIRELEKVEVLDHREVFELARELSVIEADVLEEPDYALADALAEFLAKNPRRRNETPSWLATALWAEDLVRGKPQPEAVGDALALLGMPA